MNGLKSNFCFRFNEILPLVAFATPVGCRQPTGATHYYYFNLCLAIYDAADSVIFVPNFMRIEISDRIFTVVGYSIYEVCGGWLESIGFPGDIGFFNQAFLQQ